MVEAGAVCMVPVACCSIYCTETCSSLAIALFNKFINSGDGTGLFIYTLLSNNVDKVVRMN